SPLKDRFGTQVRTHYPETLGDEIAIMDQEARTPAGHGQIPVRVPPFLKEVLAALTAELRGSAQVNQRSGVSVRYSIGNLERVAAETSDLMASGDFLAQFGALPGLGKLLGRLGVEEESPGVAASALELALEGLHLSRRLNKDSAGRAGTYRYEGLGRSR